MEETKTEQKPIGETENENINTGQKYMPEEKESGKIGRASCRERV